MDMHTDTNTLTNDFLINNYQLDKTHTQEQSILKLGFPLADIKHRLTHRFSSTTEMKQKKEQASDLLTPHLSCGNLKGTTEHQGGEGQGRLSHE